MTLADSLTGRYGRSIAARSTGRGDGRALRGGRGLCVRPSGPLRIGGRIGRSALLVPPELALGALALDQERRSGRPDGLRGEHADRSALRVRPR